MMMMSQMIDNTKVIIIPHSIYNQCFSSWPVRVKDHPVRERHAEEQ